MSKLRLVYRCSACATAYPKWAGRCPSCEAWNSMVEDVEGGEPDIAAIIAATSGAIAMPISEIDALIGGPQSTGVEELDRVLGGGLVPGSVTLLGGEPGIGKSTLLLQLAATWPTRTLYVSGEESAQQVRLRAERLGAIGPHLWLLAETSLPHIVASLDTAQPHLVIIDSIQSVADPDLGSAPGSVVQVRGCTHRLVAEAKRRGIPMVLVGHVTKDGGAGRAAGARTHRRHGAQLRRRPASRTAPAARRQAPLRFDQRAGRFRNGRTRPCRGARRQQPVPHRSTHRRRRVCGDTDTRGPPTVARRGPGADQQGQLRVCRRGAARKASIPAGWRCCWQCSNDGPGCRWASTRCSRRRSAAFG